MIEFARPELVLLVPFFVALTLMSHYFAQKIKSGLEVFHYPPLLRLSRITERKGTKRRSWRGINLALKIAVMLLITFSLAGPAYLGVVEVSKKAEIPMVEDKDLAGGIVLAVDVSASMTLKDVSPSRLDSVKSLLVEFVKNASDKVRFGVVTFDAEIKNSTSVTDDRERTLSILQGLRPSEGIPCIEEYTDIGLGLQTAVNILSPYAPFNRTYAVVLLSDGFANYGYPDPITSVSNAINQSSAKNIPVYAVHTAKVDVDSNQELMERIAHDTGGRFMKSTSIADLQNILETLSKYQTPTNTWSTVVDITTTIPQRMELGHTLMFGAVGLILILWVGNYKHYRTWF